MATDRPRNLKIAAKLLQVTSLAVLVLTQVPTPNVRKTRGRRQRGGGRLRVRAKAGGATAEQLEEAADAEDPKLALVSMLVSIESAVPTGEEVLEAELGAFT